MPPKQPVHLTFTRFGPIGTTITSATLTSFSPSGLIIPPRPDPSTPLASRLFHDAIAVRAIVFIHEQKCFWDGEIDSDDARSYHFNVHLHPSPPSPSSPSSPSDPTASPTAPTVATIRLVPGPHDPHPLPGSSDNVGGAETGIRAPGHRDVTTAMHDGYELYAKLGRLATLKEARGKGIASRMIEEAIGWATGNLGEMDRREGDGLGEDTGRVWKGLFLVHAQTDVAPLYAKAGFVEDGELGTWLEMGIPHIAMWKRVKVERGEEERRG